MSTLKKIFLLVFLLCLRAFSFAGVDPQKDVKMLKKEGETKNLKEVTKAEPSMDDELTQKVLLLHSKKLPPKIRIQQLDALVKTAIQNNLPNALALSYYEIGQAYAEMGQWQVALPFLELAEKKKTSLVPVTIYLDKALALSKTGNYAASNTDLLRFKKLSAIRENLIRADYALAENSYAQGYFREAIHAYDKILTLEREAENEIGMRDCYARLAACYISLGETKKGISYYSASLKKIGSETKYDAEKISANKELVSTALRKQGKFAEDISVLNSSSGGAFNPSSLEKLRLAESYLKIKQFVKAESSVDAYFAKPSYELIDLSEIEIIKELSALLRKQGKIEKAFRYLSLYTSLQDTIKSNRLKLEKGNAGVEGFQTILQLETLRKDKELSLNTISHLVQEDELKESAIKNHRWAIALLLGLIVLGVGAGIYILRVSKQRRVANQKLALRSLRSQMNPHFIFNALNSVNSFISENDERSANRFLSEFSRLMRSVMENSEYDFISLAKELEILRIYMQLEHFRFRDKFEYVIEVDPEIDDEAFILPPMLVQPYIENAIWHGLRYIETKGKLEVRFALKAQQLCITISDDGIGRTKSAELKTSNQKKSKSTALKNINERIQLFNELHSLHISVDIANKEVDGSGTVVTLIIPQNKL